MTVQVRIPTQLRSFIGGADETQAAGDSVGQVIDDLSARYPAIRPRLLDEDGNLRRFVNIYVNDEDVRFLQGLETQVVPGGCISIIPAIAGGQDVAAFREDLVGEVLRGAFYRQDLLRRLRDLQLEPNFGVSRPAIINEAAHEIERLQEALDHLSRSHAR